MTDVHCVFCNTIVEDERLRKIYIQEEYPDIEIGPYCPDCFQKVRICSGCQHPHLLEDGIKYYGKGKHYCDSCVETFEFCDFCGEECASPLVVEGKKYCNCCKDTRLKYCSSCSSWHKREASFFYSAISFARVVPKRYIYPELFEQYGDGLCMECAERELPLHTPQEVKACGHCGNYFAITEDSESDKYCKGCYDSFHKCDSCGTKKPSVERRLIAQKDGSLVTERLCTTCLLRLHKCDLCSTHTRGGKKVSGSFYSTFVCEYCTENRHLFSDSRAECKSCLSFKADLNEDGLCDECQRWYGKYNICSRCGKTKDEGGYCRVCDNTKIYNYSLKPQLSFLYTKNERKHEHKIFFGFENEVTYGTSRGLKERGLASLYKKYDPKVLVAKHDSSIYCEGYEVVSQPMTLDYFRRLDLSGIVNEDQHDDNSCGLHVHVDRRAFRSDVHLFKVVAFINDHEDFTNLISGRSYSGYDQKLEDKVSSAVKKKVTGDRYCRVNLSNPKTVEFRMFRGCIKEFTLRYRIEFVHALLTWASESSIMEAKSVSKFCKFVHNNSKKYNNLSKFLKAKKEEIN